MQTTYSGKEIPQLAGEKCSVIYALEVIGGKWKLPIIWKLSKKESLRYNELKRELEGITNVMLTRSLQSLEEHRLADSKRAPTYTASCGICPDRPWQSADSRSGSDQRVGAG